MNFFEHQEQSRRKTRRLVFLFILAVLAIITSVNVALLVGLGFTNAQEGVALFSAQSLKMNSGMLLTGSIATASVVGFASLFKMLSLRGGGGEVARQLGGTLVDPDSRDPLKRRLANVVEEIALASGVPVPEVYVLEREAGINAFAAGYSTSDAAVAVTRGTLEKLDRNELQGVIAHEFSHILNGDMRINIRLMGALFGILLLALIGRKVLYHSHFVGRSRDNSGLIVVALAFTLLIVGYVGLFFGRWIKSAVSRQREYLADASAVQFTRDNLGISGALKKIAIYSDASFLDVDTEEVGHMLFGQGQKASMFATHPPLMDRISRVEPGFQPEELKVVADRIKRANVRQAKVAEREEAKAARKPGVFDARSIIDNIGNPDFERILMAAALTASIPESVNRAAHSPEQSPEALLFSLLHPDPEIREQQLLLIAQEMGGDTEEQVRRLSQAAGVLKPEQRLPVLEIAMPGLTRHTPEYIRKFLLTADAMIRVDGKVEVFEYLVARLLRQYLWETANPHKVKVSGGKSLSRLKSSAREVISILAWQGNPEHPDRAEAAFRRGWQLLFANDGGEPITDSDWVKRLDKALDELDELSSTDKQKLLQAIVNTVTHDGHLVPAELELMRAVCASIHIPVPVLTGMSTASDH